MSDNEYLTKIGDDIVAKVFHKNPPIHKVNKNPKDKLWYCFGLVRSGKSTYFIPVSKGYQTKEEAINHKENEYSEFDRKGD